MSSKDKFHPGDKVYIATTPAWPAIKRQTQYNQVTLISKVPGAGPTVWVVEDPHGSLRKVNQNDLLTLSEGQAKIAEAERAQRKLEEDFEQVKSEIVQRLQEATQSLLQASKLSQPYDRKVVDLDEVYQQSRALLDALHKCGWNASSMSC